LLKPLKTYGNKWFYGIIEGDFNKDKDAQMSDINTANELDKNTKALMVTLEKELALKEKEISSKDKEIDRLKNELEFFKAQILNKNKKIFGSSSEQIADGQISIFNEAEKFTDEKLEEPTIENITYNRNKPSKNKGKKDNLANLEKVTIEHKLEPAEQLCHSCNGELVALGKKTKEILKYEPAKLLIEEHVTYSYACKTCEANEGHANIMTTKAPSTLLHKSMASNELLSHVINLKYQHHLPLYRQENYFKMMGANLSRQTLSNWMIGAANELEVVYDKMKAVLLEQSYIQADETTLKVIDNQGKDSKSKKYMWLYKTGHIKMPIILYDYQRTRSSSCPKTFLKGFTGVLQTDGYTGYNKVENIQRLYCLAHIRRKFYEIVSTLNEEALKTSIAAIGLNYCEQLY
jgi:transposase